MNNQLEIKIKDLILKSPLMTASGTSGHGNEIESLHSAKKILSSLGAFVTKGVTIEEKKGNPEFRIVETRIGLLNSIGLQNKGVRNFIENELPSLINFNLPIFINISANTIDEFGRLASILVENDFNQIIKGLEINVSCPNIKEGGVAFGVNPKQVELIVKKIRKEVGNKVLLITKLSPNVTDITLPAKGAIEGGTDALSMINTVRGMAINIDRRAPFLGNKTGGLSGPAIKPVGIYMVYTCFNEISECRKRQIPIIGIGGVANWQDALEYIMAGATGVGVGTAWFVNQEIFNDIDQGLRKYLKKNNCNISDLIGIAQ